MGRTRSQTKALNQGYVGHAWSSVESLKDKRMFELNRTGHIMAAHFVQAPETPCEGSMFGKSVGEVGAGPISHQSAQESKYRDMWNKSMREETDGLKSNGIFVECDSFC